MNFEGTTKSKLKHQRATEETTKSKSKNRQGNNNIEDKVKL